MTPRAPAPGEPSAVALLDLDGTIADSAPGIVASIRHAIRSLGYRPDPADDLKWAIGPQLAQVMARVLLTYGDTRIDEAIRLYRDRYDTVGLHEAILYPGIGVVMNSLAREGVEMILATSKRRSIAERMLKHLGLTGYFRSIYGTEPDDRGGGKVALLARLVAAERLSLQHVVMVGDRSHDIVAAHANGMRAIGVLWGYGSREELIAANANALAAAPADLRGLLTALGEDDMAGSLPENQGRGSAPDSAGA